MAPDVRHAQRTADQDGLERPPDHLDFRKFRQGAELYFSHERTRRVDGRPYAS
jgi:hypothetical protein